MKLIEGREVAKALRKQTPSIAEALRARGVNPTLAVVVPTDDEGTAWYVRSIARAADRVGVNCRIEQLAQPDHDDLVAKLEALSADENVHGIICQTPLPENVKLADVAAHIAPSKDVDGANPMSLGRLAAGLETFAPATAEAVMVLFEAIGFNLDGKDITMVGRSTVVGTPAALLMLDHGATVTICHRQTVDLEAECRTADAVVVAAGAPGLITAKHLKPGAIVIDVGTTPTEDGQLVGDVDFESASEVAGAITPVPGGVGPVTTQLLLRNTVVAAQRQNPA
ncbi:bifunctional 5,10-methylenetetrahydrofolate dehydrogenase/5,10-methenyltetrahydrofolate cyclohydrolase [Natronoglycomyces albus]|uniref:Bifunctional protein FolD n=1 Tax=Natronoglycomyces albus TaxID=2811108 RepID=A0A895XSV5_9ACTN|nr:bifunctional 5,10-methylenetetrahydrofolate dehydrogenase/5,10-methenyltetrahydrofolate cyclohydrolase [Natronoglycomyces albus]QSB06335.1 bifunctional 5,10-methylenetetrahydrofolate dehydrogenase/5,10-methenyltetrahydrofolate cyclohydrolase [Natronoglycomyces albus]